MRLLPAFMQGLGFQYKPGELIQGQGDFGIKPVPERPKKDEGAALIECGYTQNNLACDQRLLGG